MFSSRDISVSGFSAQFEVRQDCENGEEREVNVVTTVKRGRDVSLLKFYDWFLWKPSLFKLFFLELSDGR